MAQLLHQMTSKQVVLIFLVAASIVNNPIPTTSIQVKLSGVLGPLKGSPFGKNSGDPRHGHVITFETT
jgi:hypothetical protein